MSPTVARSRATSAPPRLGTRPALDGLRGAAVLAVLGAHVGQFVLPGHEFWPLQGGFLGVDVFLVLSGFLIAALLLAEVDRSGGIRVRRFFGRRATRVLPALVVLLAAHWILTLIIGASAGSELRATVLALTFTSNWEATMGFEAGAEIPLDLTHLWTLAVEGQFYLVWPVVVLVLTRAWSSPHRLLAVIGGLVVGVAVVRAVSFAVASDWSLVYTRFDTRLDSLLVGALLAVLWMRGLLPAGRWRGV
jgi:peptidoglycan/LPS O-acetylase OafA/YrhL